METLSLEKMNNIEAGASATEVVDAGCAAVGAWAAFGGPVGAGVGLFCAGWAVGRAAGALSS